MYKRPLLFISYTLVIIFASSFLTALYFQHYVMASPAAESLSFLSSEKVEQSPLQDDNTIVEVFSYACHYCEVNESGVAELEKRLPAGAKLVRLHLSDDDHAGMAAFAPLYATLTVMGSEAQHRPAAYRAIIKEILTLPEEMQLSDWLVANGIDEAAYQRARDSERVKELLAYMTAVSRYYQVNATPSFIVNRKWLALQDREFSAFSRQLLSLLQHDKPLAP